MKRQSMAAMIVLSALSGGSAYAATTTGRITYISSSRDQLMLNNSDMYAVGTGVNLSSIAVADRVKINWNKRNGEDVITAITKAPLTAASDWQG